MFVTLLAGLLGNFCWDELFDLLMFLPFDLVEVDFFFLEHKRQITTSVIKNIQKPIPAPIIADDTSTCSFLIGGKRQHKLKDI
ncbi:hypothetical protein [Photorhabdus akhurstii]|uniref:hypothetical protein n=1 Tax=Photorhabdus akhurstii TaxID=171438 RepID=UPI001FE78B95|nr:hypothetical protein [Photorhabdus akhurstii]